jgi:hypothetical protein
MGKNATAPVAGVMRRIAARFQIVFTVVIALALASCVNGPRTAFTENEESLAEIPGMPNVRFYADAPLDEVKRILDDDAISAAAHENGGFDMLAISGGAWDGAYGAGILNGWTKTGRRPKFVLVTGVSAGALIAPYAFVGPDYDPQLKDAFTSGAAEPIGNGTDNLLFTIGGAGQRRAALRALISRDATEKSLRLIAAEHKRGRRLLVATTNLDAQRTVVWNMGAIAASGHPQALDLFRDVLTASSSIPAVFEPTRISVRANGRQFEELHVDGAVTTNVFTLPDAMLTENRKRRGRMYLIMNMRLTPEFEVVNPRLRGMLERTVDTVLKTHSRATVLASMQYARLSGVDFNMTHMDMELPKELTPSFETDYMRAVFALGYDRAAAGNFWEKTILSQGRRKELARASQYTPAR